MDGIVYSFGVHRMLGMQGTEEQNNCSQTAPCLGLIKNLFFTRHIAENKQYSRAFIFSSVDTFIAMRLGQTVATLRKSTLVLYRQY
jgi:hypothetical protein